MRPPKFGDKPPLSNVAFVSDGTPTGTRMFINIADLDFADCDGWAEVRGVQSVEVEVDQTSLTTATVKLVAVNLGKRP